MISKDVLTDYIEQFMTLPQIVEDLNKTTAKQNAMLQRLQEECLGIKSRLEEVRENQANLYDRNEAFELASMQHEKVSEDFYFNRVVQPVGRELISVLTTLSQDESNAEVLNVVGQQVAETLYRLGFSPIECKVGDLFDSEWMQVVKEVSTSSRGNNLTVAKVRQQGFCHGSWKHHTRVDVYKY